MKRKREKKNGETGGTGNRYRRSAEINEKISRLCRGWCPGKQEVEDRLRVLSLDRNIQERMEVYYAQKTELILKIVAAGLLTAGLLAFFSFRTSVLTDGYFLPRRETAYTQELELTAEGEKKETVTVEVVPREPEPEECRKMLEQAMAQMEQLILGENESLEEVRADLNLAEQIDGIPVEIEWELDSYEVMNMDGTLRQDRLKEEGSLVELKAKMTCGSEEAVYRAAARVFPPVLTEEEKWQNQVQDSLKESGEQSRYEELQKLPEKIQNAAVSWSEKKRTPVAAVAVLTLFCAAAAYIGKDRELKQKVREREQQMYGDYARIVTKLVLLMEAGAAVRNAWEMAVSDYQGRKEEGREGFRYAYEEMALAVREMHSGTAEVRAYENFGIRCRLPCYLKLSLLLEQNVRKGSRGLSELLKAEVGEAFEQRKEVAVIRGEETSSKLLFPLILMLAVVMLMILIPAGMSLNM